MKAFFFGFFLVVSLDLASKVVLSQVLPERLVVVEGLLDLVKVRNTGVAFGLFSSSGEWTRVVFTVFAFLASGVLFWYSLRAPSGFCRFVLGAVSGGAVGNALDRLVNGAVFDFVDLHIGSYHWPAFNIADAAITVGVFLFLWRCRS